MAPRSEKRETKARPRSIYILGFSSARSGESPSLSGPRVRSRPSPAWSLISWACGGFEERKKKLREEVGIEDTVSGDVEGRGDGQER